MFCYCRRIVTMNIKLSDELKATVQLGKYMLIEIEFYRDRELIEIEIEIEICNTISFT